ncbi:MAG: DUF2029 domain-containing protein [Candidatus Dormibacteraeota bacterium]|nr:DUF2029 domain-containing protein [Candidatus Dormibacteraeota bacterium]
MSSQRARLGVAVLLVAAAAVLAHYVQVWSAIPPVEARTSDFAGTYASATLWRTGHPADLYNVGAQEGVSRAQGAPGNHLFVPFENPPLAAVVASPLTLLDATAAYRAWSLLQLGALVAALAIAARAAPWPSRRPHLSATACAGVALAGFGTGLLFVEGQWDGVPALGLALAYAGWTSGRRFVPGFATGFAFGIAKPHLAAGVIAFMAGRRDWHGLAGVVAGGASVAAGGVVLAGPGATAGFIRALLQPVNSPPAQMQGSSGITGSLLGSGLAPYALALLLAAIALVAAGWLGTVSRRRPALLEPALLGATALSLWASPHLLGHDLVVLAPPLVAMFAWTMRAERQSAAAWPGPASLALVAGWVALSYASLFDLGQGGVGLPGRLTPWVLLACAVAASGAVWRLTRGEPMPAAPAGGSRVMEEAHHPA